MSLFKKLFSKDDTSNIPKGYHRLKVKGIVKVTSDTSEIQLEVPQELTNEFKFISGQYLDFSIQLNGVEERRSYSICSGTNEPLAFAVKKVENGKISSWMNSELKVGSDLFVGPPKGNFMLKKEKSIIAVAAGSGITPILSIAKEIEKSNESKLKLFFGSKTEANIIFKSQIDALKNTTVDYFLSQETKENYKIGRINKESFIEIIKSDLEILKADGFFLCGPGEMIFGVKEALEMFGIPKEKIHFELFTTPLNHIEEGLSDEIIVFEGTSKVTVIVDEMEYSFELDAKGKTILDKADQEGADVPYSCRGGVCSTCKAKIMKGKVTMKLNYSLTDKEIEDGYILACQAHPASEKVILSFDE
jgi:ring-1,2-phenylacetyl-CoA epoxidase subunit PaaE